jgi:hypothetical protein
MRSAAGAEESREDFANGIRFNIAYEGIEEK